MASLKNIYDLKAIKKISLDIKKNYSKFNTSDFEASCSSKIKKLELKQRVKVISSELSHFLTSDYNKNIEILVNSLAPEENSQTNSWTGNKSKGISGFHVWPLTQYVEDYGLDSLEISMNALYEMTKRFTAEFALRSFLNKYGEQIHKRFLEKWVHDSSEHVRRLVSEGTRPSLPWGQNVTWISENPGASLYLLERLKDDKSLYVRKSVANHLNDISYIDKKTFFNFFKQLDLEKKHLKWIARHASRSLLKSGEIEALRLNGYSVNPKVEIRNFKLTDKKIKIGNKIKFMFVIKNIGNKELNLLLDYIIYYKAKNSKLRSKTFRIKAIKLSKNESFKIEKQIDFKKITTRHYYPGKHYVQIKVCNTFMNKKAFELLDS